MDPEKEMEAMLRSIFLEESIKHLPLEIFKNKVKQSY